MQVRLELNTEVLKSANMLQMSGLKLDTSALSPSTLQDAINTYMTQIKTLGEKIVASEAREQKLLTELKSKNERVRARIVANLAF